MKSPDMNRFISRMGLMTLVLLGTSGGLYSQYPPAQLRMMESHQLPSSTPPPEIPALSLPDTQTLGQYRTEKIKEFVTKAGQPQYRSVAGQIYNLEALTDFLNWVGELPNTEDTKAMLKTRTRPLPAWSLVYGRVAQLTDGNGVLLWKYEQPEMVSSPKLVRLRNYPIEKKLVDGDIVVAFAMIEAPYSYIDSQRGKSTVNSFDFGKPVTRQEVDLFIEKRPLPTIVLPKRTNAPASKPAAH